VALWLNHELSSPANVEKIGFLNKLQKLNERDKKK
jgi:hypothetical protein